MEKLAIILTLGILIGACSSPSSYKSASNSGYGYTETQIDQQRFRLVFKSRENNKNPAMDYALLRAAELTLQQGYDWFEVIDSSAQFNLGEERSKVEAQLEIWMDKGVRPDSVSAYSALEVANTLGQQISNTESD